MGRLVSLQTLSNVRGRIAGSNNHHVSHFREIIQIVVPPVGGNNKFESIQHHVFKIHESFFFLNVLTVTAFPHVTR